MKQGFDLESFLKTNVKPALGCTEVVVIGLASSAAWLAARNKVPTFLDSDQASKEKISKPTSTQIEQVIIELDRNVFKNAMSVNLPMPDNLIDDMQKGIEFAAALGLVSDVEELEQAELLTLFSNINQQKIEKAKDIRQKAHFNVRVVDDWTGQANLKVKVRIDFNDHDLEFAEARLEHRHDHYSYIANSLGILYQDQETETVGSNNHNQNQQSLVGQLSISEMLEQITDLSSEVKRHLLKNIKLNTELSNKGLEGKHGLKLGWHLKQLIQEGTMANDIVNYAKYKAAAAADARMGGALLPAMSTAGSGNQGITATMPIIAVADMMGADKLGLSQSQQQEKLLQALALSHLITGYIAYYSGHLSALCGCAVKAGIGAAAGVCYYLGGNQKLITLAINNMTANITGVICDGAKEGCALKLATATCSAVESALLAMRYVAAPTDNGILAETVEQTLQNLGKISDAMVKTDQTIVQETMLSE